MISHDPPPPLCETSTRTFARVREWIGSEQKGRNQPLVVGIGGPGGCGKSTLSRWLYHNMSGVEILSLDDFRLPREERPEHGRFGSHPEGNDLDRLESVLEEAKSGGTVMQPVFDPERGRVVREVELRPARLILADGEIAAHDHLRPHFDRLILVDAHWRTQLNTRLTRDLRERHCSLEKAIDIFLQSNLRDYPRYAAGAMEEADVVLYRTVKHVFTLRRGPESRAAPVPGAE
jgi:uridine kinase